MSDTVYKYFWNWGISTTTITPASTADIVPDFIFSPNSYFVIPGKTSQLKAQN
jgi:hypothetical protein